MNRRSPRYPKVVLFSSSGIFTFKVPFLLRFSRSNRFYHLKNTFMGKAQSTVETAPVAEPLLDKELTRKKFLFKQISIGDQIATQSITFWEELTCVGYNPREKRLEGMVSIKQATGYSGTLCNPSSKEYVRFFVDFKDGSGYQEMGYTSFKACDIPHASHWQQHTIMYMTNIY